MKFIPNMPETRRFRLCALKQCSGEEMQHKQCSPCWWRRARRRPGPQSARHHPEQPGTHPKLPTPLPLRNARSTSCYPSQTCRGHVRSNVHRVACAKRALRVAHQRLLRIVWHVRIFPMESLCVCAHGSAMRRKRTVVATYITLDTP